MITKNERTKILEYIQLNNTNNQPINKTMSENKTNTNEEKTKTNQNNKNYIQKKETKIEKSISKVTEDYQEEKSFQEITNNNNQSTIFKKENTQIYKKEKENSNELAELHQYEHIVEVNKTANQKSYNQDLGQNILKDLENKKPKNNAEIGPIYKSINIKSTSIIKLDEQNHNIELSINSNNLSKSKTEPNKDLQLTLNENKSNLTKVVVGNAEELNEKEVCKSKKKNNTHI